MAGKKGDVKKKEAKPVPRERALAKRATAIAEAGGSGMGSAITAPQALALIGALGDDPLSRFAPATLEQMRGYAQAGRGGGREHLPDEGLKRLREFCRELDSRRIWPRKVAAVIVALAEEEKT